MEFLKGKMIRRGKNLATLLPGLLISLSVLLWLSGCLEADTRGAEDPDEVIISGTPTWENGVGELMQLKCAVCHQVPAGALSPANVPDDLDLNFQFAPSSSVRGARDILEFIDAGILRGAQDGVRQMPLEYATPVTSQEIDALETWSAGGGL